MDNLPIKTEEGDTRPGTDKCSEVTTTLSEMRLTHNPPLTSDTLFNMLGGRTMKDFIKLDEDDRYAIFSQYLVAYESIEMYEFMDLSKVDAIHALLLFKKHFGSSKLGQRLS
ncbi:hypothetical protein BKA56DRAFT_623652 [Ilyonectria sp. MPI-CAGE-AT-0026]|nr:hypothetical protein BKA56DRAFT_626332 [Ilyonectria sp. MPI-CAGE-AT-0026]KAH6961679.1 hypothetical protein BKA56DRAFT_623652 [Ilyonectria sp. MPI-CAGE-AT-0026]